jgi:hypothetical protein
MVVTSQADQDAEHLRLLSIFHYIVAGMMALWGSFPIIHFIIGIFLVLGKFPHGTSGQPGPVFAGWFFVLFAGAWMLVGWSLAVTTVFAARFLRQRRKYLYCLVVAGVMAATCMPFGTVLGVFTIIVLMRPSVKEAFAGSAATSQAVAAQP